MKKPAVYIMTDKPYGTLYIGTTSNLEQRVFQHKNNFLPGFTSKYSCKILVFCEFFETMTNAIEAEKKLKKRLRKYKIQLITNKNPEWLDLSDKQESQENASKFKRDPHATLRMTDLRQHSNATFCSTNSTSETCQCYEAQARSSHSVEDDSIESHQ